MKTNVLLHGFILLMSTALIGCAGGQKSGSDSHDGSETSVELPVLTQSQTIAFENEDLRILKSGDGADDIDSLMIQAKSADFTSFVIEGVELEVEDVVSDHLILSDGEDDVVTLEVYNLRTAKRIAQVDQYMRGLMTVEDDNRINVLMFDKEYPVVEWIPETSTWKFLNEVPLSLANELPALKDKYKDRIKENFRLMAYRKVRIHLKERRVEYLNEYEWDYTY